MARKFCVEGFGSGSGSSSAYAVSLEEEQILQAEANADRVEADKLEEDGEQAIEISDALEDLAVVADSIPEASQSDAELLEIAGRMATAGTDVEPEDVVPAMESYVGRKMSTEGIRDTARKIWEAIKKICKKIWEKVESFFYKLFGTIPSLRKRIQDLKKKAEAKNGSELNEKKITISSGVAYLQVNYEKKADPDFQAGIKKYTEIAKEVVESATAFKKLGEEIADLIQGFDPSSNNNEDALKNMADGVQDIFDDGVKKSKGAEESDRFSGYSFKIDEHLPGNICVGTKYKKNGNDGTALGASEVVRSYQCLIANSDKTGKKKAPDEIQINTLTPGDIESLCDGLIDLLEQVEEYRRGRAWKDLQKAQADLQKASDKAEAAMNKAKSDEDEKKSVPHYRSMINFNLAFANWVKNPAMSLSHHALAYTRAVMMVAEKSLAQYK